MPEGGYSNRKIVAQSSSEVPNHPQPTNFMHAEHPPGGPDEMCIPKGLENKVTRGEDAVMKFRTPY
jgi:hypothetical protein